MLAYLHIHLCMHLPSYALTYRPTYIGHPHTYAIYLPSYAPTDLRIPTYSYPPLHIHLYMPIRFSISTYFHIPNCIPACPSTLNEYTDPHA